MPPWRAGRGGPERALPLLARPGPKTLGPLPFDQIRRGHRCAPPPPEAARPGRPRYIPHRDSISRRDLAALVAAERERINGAAARTFRHVRWKEPTSPGPSMPRVRPRRGRAQTRAGPRARPGIAFRFRAARHARATGAAVARYLRAYSGARRPAVPQARQRGIFNDRAVDDVLAAHGVIPLTAPPPTALQRPIERGDPATQAGPSLLPARRPPSWDPGANRRPFAAAAAHLRNCARAAPWAATRRPRLLSQQPLPLQPADRHAAFGWIRRRLECYSTTNGEG